MELTPDAKSALYNVGTNRQGATVPPRTPEKVLSELRIKGLIGDGRGITRKGSIVREQIVSAALDEAF